MKHIKAEHEGVRYECDQCDNKAKEKSNLKKHIDGEHKGLVVASKTFPCSQCDFKVMCRKNLIKHTESEHLGIKPQAQAGPID